MVCVTLLGTLVSHGGGCGDTRPSGPSTQQAELENGDSMSEHESVPAASEPDPAARFPSVPAALLQAVIEDLAKYTGAAPGTVRVKQAQPMTWNDGSLGCPEPGMSYIQVLVPGYWLVLEHDGREYDYRAGRGSHFKRCAQPPPGPPRGRPGSEDA